MKRRDFLRSLVVAQVAGIAAITGTNRVDGVTELTFSFSPNRDGKTWLRNSQTVFQRYQNWKMLELQVVKVITKQ